MGKTKERPAQGGAKGDINQPPRDSVPLLNTEVSTPIKYLGNFD